MILYRIVHALYASDLTGRGAELNGGRWNSEGIAMLYLSESSALAMAEALVHLPNPRRTITHKLVSIELPDPSPIDDFPLNKLKQILSDLAVARLDAIPLPISRKIGDDFVRHGTYLGLKVPSVLVPHSFNYLINPKHPLAVSMKIQNVEDFDFDARLRGS